MWCFVDESWHEGKKEEVGVLAGAIGPKEDFENLEHKLYQIRRKYFGEDHARDHMRELKGKDLLSNHSFALLDEGYSKNLTVAREVIEWVRTDSHIRVIGVTVYGNTRPPLLAPRAKQLTRPFKELCIRLNAHVPPGKKGFLIFDQRIGAQEEISIAVRNYLAGLPAPHRVVPYPLIGVSNVWAGIQLADIVAHILGRYAVGNDKFLEWYKRVKSIQTEGENHLKHHMYGLVRLQWTGEDHFEERRERMRQ